MWVEKGRKWVKLSCDFKVKIGKVKRREVVKKGQP